MLLLSTIATTIVADIAEESTTQAGTAGNGIWQVTPDASASSRDPNNSLETDDNDTVTNEATTVSIVQSQSTSDRHTEEGTDDASLVATVVGSKTSSSSVENTPTAAIFYGMSATLSADSSTAARTSDSISDVTTIKSITAATKVEHVPITTDVVSTSAAVPVQSMTAVAIAESPSVATQPESKPVATTVVDTLAAQHLLTAAKLDITPATATVSSIRSDSTVDNLPAVTPVGSTPAATAADSAPAAATDSTPAASAKDRTSAAVAAGSLVAAAAVGSTSAAAAVDITSVGVNSTPTFTSFEGRPAGVDSTPIVAAADGTSTSAAIGFTAGSTLAAKETENTQAATAGSSISTAAAAESTPAATAADSTPAAAAVDSRSAFAAAYFTTHATAFDSVPTATAVTITPVATAAGSSRMAAAAAVNSTLAADVSILTAPAVHSPVMTVDGMLLSAGLDVTAAGTPVMSTPAVRTADSSLVTAAVYNTATAGDGMPGAFGSTLPAIAAASTPMTTGASSSPPAAAVGSTLTAAAVQSTSAAESMLQSATVAMAAAATTAEITPAGVTEGKTAPATTFDSTPAGATADSTPAIAVSDSMLTSAAADITEAATTVENTPAPAAVDTTPATVGITNAATADSSAAAAAANSTLSPITIKSNPTPSAEDSTFPVPTTDTTVTTDVDILLVTAAIGNTSVSAAARSTSLAAASDVTPGAPIPEGSLAATAADSTSAAAAVNYSPSGTTVASTRQAMEVDTISATIDSVSAAATIDSSHGAAEVDSTIAAVVSDRTPATTTSDGTTATTMAESPPSALAGDTMPAVAASGSPSTAVSVGDSPSAAAIDRSLVYARPKSTLFNTDIGTIAAALKSGRESATSSIVTPPVSSYSEEVTGGQITPGYEESGTSLDFRVSSALPSVHGRESSYSTTILDGSTKSDTSASTESLERVPGSVQQLAFSGKAKDVWSTTSGGSIVTAHSVFLSTQHEFQGPESAYAVEMLGTSLLNKAGESTRFSHTDIGMTQSSLQESGSPGTVVPSAMTTAKQAETNSPSSAHSIHGSERSDHPTSISVTTVLRKEDSSTQTFHSEHPSTKRSVQEGDFAESTLYSVKDGALSYLTDIFGTATSDIKDEYTQPVGLELSNPTEIFNTPASGKSHEPTQSFSFELQGSTQFHGAEFSYPVRVETSPLSDHEERTMSLQSEHQTTVSPFHEPESSYSNGVPKTSVIVGSKDFTQESSDHILSAAYSVQASDSSPLDNELQTSTWHDNEKSTQPEISSNASSQDSAMSSTVTPPVSLYSGEVTGGQTTPGYEETGTSLDFRVSSALPSVQGRESSYSTTILDGSTKGNTSASAELLTSELVSISGLVQQPGSSREAETVRSRTSGDSMLTAHSVFPKTQHEFQGPESTYDVEMLGTSLLNKAGESTSFSHTDTGMTQRSLQGSGSFGTAVPFEITTATQAETDAPSSEHTIHGSERSDYPSSISVTTVLSKEEASTQTFHPEHPRTTYLDQEDDFTETTLYSVKDGASSYLTETSGAATLDIKDEYTQSGWLELSNPTEVISSPTSGRSHEPTQSFNLDIQGSTQFHGAESSYPLETETSPLSDHEERTIPLQSELQTAVSPFHEPESSYSNGIPETSVIVESKDFTQESSDEYLSVPHSVQASDFSPLDNDLQTSTWHDDERSTQPELSSNASPSRRDVTTVTNATERPRGHRRTHPPVNITHPVNRSLEPHRHSPHEERPAAFGAGLRIIARILSAIFSDGTGDDAAHPGHHSSGSPIRDRLNSTVSSEPQLVRTTRLGAPGTMTRSISTSSGALQITTKISGSYSAEPRSGADQFPDTAATAHADGEGLTETSSPVDIDKPSSLPSSATSGNFYATPFMATELTETWLSSEQLGMPTSVKADGEGLTETSSPVDIDKPSSLPSSAISSDFFASFFMATELPETWLSSEQQGMPTTAGVLGLTENGAMAVQSSTPPAVDQSVTSQAIDQSSMQPMTEQPSITQVSGLTENGATAVQSSMPPAVDQLVASRSIDQSIMSPMTEQLSITQAYCDQFIGGTQPPECVGALMGNQSGYSEEVLAAPEPSNITGGIQLTGAMPDVPLNLTTNRTPLEATDVVGSSDITSKQEMTAVTGDVLSSTQDPLAQSLLKNADEGSSSIYLGVGIGVGVAILLLAGGTVLFLKRYLRQHSNVSPQTQP